MIIRALEKPNGKSEPDQKPACQTLNNIENITFGVEIETTVPLTSQVIIGAYHVGAPAISATTLEGERKQFPLFEGNAWKAERDGSILAAKAGHKACEFVSPVLKGEAGILHLIAFVEFLREIGAAVNPTCGMHIHVGVGSAAAGEEITGYLERLVRLVSFNSKALYAQTGTVNRERGIYCAPLGERTRQAVKKAKKRKVVAEAAATGSRYHILNLTNLPRTGTAEFRCFAATLNTNKVLLHLFSVLALCIIARKAKTPVHWENKTITGTKALTNFLKVRPMARIVGSPTMTERFPRMISKALEMGAKYDLAEAGCDLQTLANA